MNKIFYHAEQTGNFVTFFDSVGTETCLQTDLEAYIEANRLNYHTTDEDEAKEYRFMSDSDYLDNHWDQITLKYWNENFNK